MDKNAFTALFFQALYDVFCKLEVIGIGYVENEIGLLNLGLNQLVVGMRALNDGDPLWCQCFDSLTG